MLRFLLRLEWSLGSYGCASRRRRRPFRAAVRLGSWSLVASIIGLLYPGYWD
jgi:hypothetical protein